MYLAVALFLVLLAVATTWRRPKDFPPGPASLPLVGSFFSVPLRSIHVAMESLRRRHGPVVGVMFGPRPVVLVAGAAAVREVLRRDEFQARPELFFFKARGFGKRLGVVFSDGDLWMEQRRFALRHLRDFGFGKTSMDAIMHEEVMELFKELRKNSCFQVSGVFNKCMVNVLWTVMAGRRFSYQDEKFLEILRFVYKSFRANIPGGLLVNVMPFLRFIIPKFSGYEESMEYVTGLQNILRDTIKEHRETFDGQEPRDFIDVYLQEIEKQKHSADTTFTDESLIVLCIDLFIAGSDTVSNSLEFCLMYMVLYPEVQRAVQEELDAVIGRNHKPSIADMSRLPYFEAVIAEVSRINVVVPVPPPHRCTRQATINGYVIPQDTTMFINLWAVMHDEEHWGDPGRFRPERFLDAEGRFARDPWLSVFGLGKRACLGESLARASLCVFFASLLQGFSLRLPEGDPPPSTRSRPGLTATPQPFRVELTPR
ncbi:methyl farnesoate epoxidase-like [Bacillus rossius redtenbacheri]|uniref:methyl farnesoate epoxidase-like n=1 Tax=Bacillus rossius redtenbacheri TaxID=93214 RepID=UPI002FDD25AA